MDAVNLTPMTALLMMMAVYLVLGLFLESLSMMLLTIPIFFPIVQILGIDPVWFGILVVVAIEISLITPPVGLNVFILKIMVKNISLATIFRGIIPSSSPISSASRSCSRFRRWSCSCRE
jgi:C4-dicarboxylate transporter, DctM subunit